MTNLLADLPRSLSHEITETLLTSTHVRIEKILSQGHTSPTSGWYDQQENEWVVVLEGAGRLLFDCGRTQHLSAGDSINIPAHQKHKVIWTDPNKITVWLAVFYS